MERPPRPILDHSTCTSLVRRSMLVSLLVLLGFGVSCKSTQQTRSEPEPPPPVKVLRVEEQKSLPLLAEFGKIGTGESKGPARFVTVTLQFDPTVRSFSLRDVFLISNDEQVFDASGWGDANEGYCLDPVFETSLERQGDRFKGDCASDVGLRNGITMVNPIAVFFVPGSVPISALELSYHVLAGTVPAYPPAKDWTKLRLGLIAAVKESSGSPATGGESQPTSVNYVLDVKNTGQTPFRIHGGTVQVRVPGEEAAAQLFGEWWPLTSAATQPAGATSQGKSEGKPLVALAPGETRTLSLSFEFVRGQRALHGKSVDPSRCELGFFREHVIRLADVARSAPTAAPKK